MHYSLCRIALLNRPDDPDRWCIEVQYAEWESGDHTPDLTGGTQEVRAAGVARALERLFEALGAPEDCLFTLNGQRTNGPLDLVERATKLVTGYGDNLYGEHTCAPLGRTENERTPKNN